MAVDRVHRHGAVRSRARAAGPARPRRSAPFRAGMSRGGIRVLEPGVLTTIQDRGRCGWAHLGVPRSGPVDRRGFALANRLVGNWPGAAVLEVTLGGPTLAFDVAAWVAVAGGLVQVAVDARPVGMDVAVAVPAGAVLRI